ncbi:hypothetical protein N7481_000958 [Penicillium waksmanii]|uniref:uncharacterized protein n=1 Tax=Penicillium waksmanii TaxID=69791 RepID=UPI002549529F|nr:uncharacterized protein N7481_000958 [Penicillium waksmanii]KAJ6000549.1 hypothetical protein N7481_000958 [Penicillium waksmanii]
MSIAMGFHWAFYFGCSRAMPSLLAASQKWGAFVFFVCICLISLAYVYFAMPVKLPPHMINTTQSFTNTDKMFRIPPDDQRPWYTVHKVAYTKHDEIQIEQVGKLQVEHLESA